MQKADLIIRHYPGSSEYLLRRCLHLFLRRPLPNPNISSQSIWGMSCHSEISIHVVASISPVSESCHYRWFQLIWRILVKLEIFPQIRGWRLEKKKLKHSKISPRSYLHYFAVSWNLGDHLLWTTRNKTTKDESPNYSTLYSHRIHVSHSNVVSILPEWKYFNFRVEPGANLEMSTKDI